MADTLLFSSFTSTFRSNQLESDPSRRNLNFVRASVLPVEQNDEKERKIKGNSFIRPRIRLHLRKPYQPILHFKVFSAKQGSEPEDIVELDANENPYGPPHEVEEAIRGVPSLLASTGERIASNITELIGWTPLVELKKIAKKDGVDARLVAKLEFYQPLSSVKDRSAIRMIEDAEEKGLITPGMTTLVVPTSGNLGIGISFVARQKGYQVIAVMLDQYSKHKETLVQLLGSEVDLMEKTKGIDELIKRAEELEKQIPNGHVLEQFKNPANLDAHVRWTGPEIWKDTAGKIDIFVAGSGSGGTVSGVGRYLKTKNRNIKIVVVEPTESNVISGGKHGRHKIQGVGPGIVPENLDRKVIDEIVTVSSEEAMVNARRLATEEGVLVGISSGAALAASLKLAAKEENKGKMIVMVLPSGGERCVGSDLFVVKKNV